MAVISITAANVLASAQATIRREYTLAAAGMTAGQFVFLNASNQWALVDQDGALGTGINDLRGILLSGGGIGQPAAVCTADPDFTPGGTTTNGLMVYGSVTAGGITTADIPATPSYPIALGLCKSATKMNLSISASGVVM